MDKGVNLSFANTDSPSTSATWVNMAKDKRISLLESSIQLFSPQIDLKVVEAYENGQVSIHINSAIEINDRGEFLLDLYVGTNGQYSSRGNIINGKWI